MKLFDLLNSLNINHITLSNKENVELVDSTYAFLKTGNTVSLVFKTSTEFSGMSAIVIPPITCPFDTERCTPQFYKTKENSLMAQLDWYNKLKPILTACVKNRTTVDTLPISDSQLELICSYYKSYRISGSFLIKTK